MLHHSLFPSCVARRDAHVGGGRHASGGVCGVDLVQILCSFLSSRTISSVVARSGCASPRSTRSCLRSATHQGSRAEGFRVLRVSGPTLRVGTFGGTHLFSPRSRTELPRKGELRAVSPRTFPMRPVTSDLRPSIPLRLLSTAAPHAETPESQVLRLLSLTRVLERT
eukprot:2562383-Rhodomonas_salina.3